MWETWQNHDFDTEIIGMALIKEVKQVKLAAPILLAKSLFPLSLFISGTIKGQILEESKKTTAVYTSISTEFLFFKDAILILCAW